MSLKSVSPSFRTNMINIDSQVYHIRGRYTLHAGLTKKLQELKDPTDENEEKLLYPKDLVFCHEGCEDAYVLVRFKDGETKPEIEVRHRLVSTKLPGDAGAEKGIHYTRCQLKYTDPFCYRGKWNAKNIVTPSQEITYPDGADITKYYFEKDPDGRSMGSREYVRSAPGEPYQQVPNQAYWNREILPLGLLNIQANYDQSFGSNYPMTAVETMSVYQSEKYPGSEKRGNGIWVTNTQPESQCDDGPDSGCGSDYDHFVEPAFSDNVKNLHYFVLRPQPENDNGVSGGLVARFIRKEGDGKVQGALQSDCGVQPQFKNNQFEESGIYNDFFNRWDRNELDTAVFHYYGTPDGKADNKDINYGGAGGEQNLTQFQLRYMPKASVAETKANFPGQQLGIYRHFDPKGRYRSVKKGADGSDGLVKSLHGKDRTKEEGDFIAPKLLAGSTPTAILEGDNGEESSVQVQDLDWRTQVLCAARWTFTQWPYIKRYKDADSTNFDASDEGMTRNVEQLYIQGHYVFRGAERLCRGYSAWVPFGYSGPTTATGLSYQNNTSIIKDATGGSSTINWFEECRYFFEMDERDRRVTQSDNERDIGKYKFKTRMKDGHLHCVTRGGAQKSVYLHRGEAGKDLCDILGPVQCVFELDEDNDRTFQFKRSDDLEMTPEYEDENKTKVSFVPNWSWLVAGYTPGATIIRHYFNEGEPPNYEADQSVNRTPVLSADGLSVSYSVDKEKQMKGAITRYDPTKDDEGDGFKGETHVYTVAGRKHDMFNDAMLEWDWEVKHIDYEKTAELQNAPEPTTAMRQARSLSNSYRTDASGSSPDASGSSPDASGSSPDASGSNSNNDQQQQQALNVVFLKDSEGKDLQGAFRPVPRPLAADPVFFARTAHEIQQEATWGEVTKDMSEDEKKKRIRQNVLERIKEENKSLVAASAERERDRARGGPGMAAGERIYFVGAFAIVADWTKWDTWIRQDLRKRGNMDKNPEDYDDYELGTSDDAVGYDDARYQDDAGSSGGGGGSSGGSGGGGGGTGSKFAAFRDCVARKNKNIMRDRRALSRQVLDMLKNNKCENRLTTEYDILRGGSNRQINASSSSDADFGMPPLWGAGAESESSYSNVHTVNPDNQAPEPNTKINQSGCEMLSTQINTQIINQNRTSCFIESTSVKQNVQVVAVATVETGDITQKGCCNLSIYNESDASIKASQAVNITSTMDSSDTQSATNLALLDQQQTATHMNKNNLEYERDSDKLKHSKRNLLNGEQASYPSKNDLEIGLQTRVRHFTNPVAGKSAAESFANMNTNNSTLKLTENSAEQTLTAEAKATVKIGNIDQECYTHKKTIRETDEDTGITTVSEEVYCAISQQELEGSSDRFRMTERTVHGSQGEEDGAGGVKDYPKMYFEGEELIRVQGENNQGAPVYANDDGERISTFGYWHSPGLAAKMNQFIVSEETKKEKDFPVMPNVINYIEKMRMYKNTMEKLFKDFKAQSAATAPTTGGAESAISPFNLFFGKDTTEAFTATPIDQGGTAYVLNLKDWSNSIVVRDLVSGQENLFQKYFTNLVEEGGEVTLKDRDSELFWQSDEDGEVFRPKTGTGVVRLFKRFTKLPRYQIVRVADSDGNVLRYVENPCELQKNPEASEQSGALEFVETGKSMRPEILRDLPDGALKNYATSLSITNIASAHVVATQSFGSVMSSVFKSIQDSDNKAEFFSDQKLTKEDVYDSKAAPPTPDPVTDVGGLATAGVTTLLTFLFLAMFVLTYFYLRKKHKEWSFYGVDGKGWGVVAKDKGVGSILSLKGIYGKFFKGTEFIYVPKNGEGGGTDETDENGGGSQQFAWHKPAGGYVIQKLKAAEGGKWVVNEEAAALAKNQNQNPWTLFQNDFEMEMKSSDNKQTMGGGSAAFPAFLTGRSENTKTADTTSCQELMCAEKVNNVKEWRKWSLRNHPDKAGLEATPKYQAVLDCKEKNEYCTPESAAEKAEKAPAPAPAPALAPAPAQQQVQPRPPATSPDAQTKLKKSKEKVLGSSSILFAAENGGKVQGYSGWKNVFLGVPNTKPGFPKEMFWDDKWFLIIFVLAGLLIAINLIVGAVEDSMGFAGNMVSSFLGDIVGTVVTIVIVIIATIIVASGLLGSLSKMKYYFKHGIVWGLGIPFICLYVFYASALAIIFGGGGSTTGYILPAAVLYVLVAFRIYGMIKKPWAASGGSNSSPTVEATSLEEADTTGTRNRSGGISSREGGVDDGGQPQLSTVSEPPLPSLPRSGGISSGEGGTDDGGQQQLSTVSELPKPPLPSSLPPSLPPPSLGPSPNNKF
jgi:hypothetical protein